MESFELGGKQVSRLGMGGCPLGGHGWGAVDDRQLVAAVRRALEQGVTFFDTADVYGRGRSEEILADALGQDRSKVVIASKGGVRFTAEGKTFKDIRPAYLREAVEGSLRRLRLESLPLYYIHWPDGQTPVEEAVAELDRMRVEGKIEAIGVSNFTTDELRRAQQVAAISAVQVQYSLAERTQAEALLPAARQLQIPLITWGSLAQGMLTGKFTAQSKFGADDRRSRYENFQGDKLRSNLELVEVLHSIAGRLDRSPAQIAMRWLLDTAGVGCVLFGAKRPEQVDENTTSAGDWSLPEADYLRLRDFAQERKLVA
ncbi:aldo/keto reductase [Lignipirellula cremea]|uniref:General stress protein 69 n=1 Tax=Lignipirellula cremea TaxID=2528010 RepID=A0A518E4N2_9BACT|nr:aldo/keto reductase [Lignipirellula cremea]QDU99042.1 General stress protein 69 [Lignipirellula cremea]